MTASRKKVGNAIYSSAGARPRRRADVGEEAQAPREQRGSEQPERCGEHRLRRGERGLHREVGHAVQRGAAKRELGQSRRRKAGDRARTPCSRHRASARARAGATPALRRRGCARRGAACNRCPRTASSPRDRRCTPRPRAATSRGRRSRSSPRSASRQGARSKAPRARRRRRTPGRSPRRSARRSASRAPRHSGRGAHWRDPESRSRCRARIPARAGTTHDYFPVFAR